MNDDRRSIRGRTAAESGLAHEGADASAHEDRRAVQRDVAAMLSGFALLAFALLASGGFGIWWTNLLVVAVGCGAMVTHRRSARVAWRRGDVGRLALTVSLALGWVILCNAYFVNWDPHRLPAAPVVGGVVAATPLLVLARRYRS